MQARWDIYRKLFAVSCLSRTLKHRTVLELSRDRILPDTILLFANLLKPAHIVTQYLRYRDASIRLLKVFEDCHKRAANGQPGSIDGMDKLCLRILLPDCALISNVGPPGLKSFKVATRGDLPIVVLRREPDFDVVGFCRREPHIAGAEYDDSVVKP